VLVYGDRTRDLNNTRLQLPPPLPNFSWCGKLFKKYQSLNLPPWRVRSSSHSFATVFYELCVVTEDSFIQNNYFFVWEHILSTVICLTSRCDIMAVGRYHYKLWLWNAPREFSTRWRLYEKLPRSLPPPSSPWSLI